MGCPSSLRRRSAGSGFTGNCELNEKADQHQAHENPRHPRVPTKPPVIALLSHSPSHPTGAGIAARLNPPQRLQPTWSLAKWAYDPDGQLILHVVCVVNSCLLIPGHDYY